jgi:putative endonuclease
MGEHNELGKEGEERARQFLVSKSYKILELNWRYHHKEIDIIADLEDYLVVIEVKTRSSDFFDDITTVITNKKKRFLIEATEAYIEKHNITKETRFDLIFISNDNIEHIEEAFNSFDI